MNSKFNGGCDMKHLTKTQSATLDYMREFFNANDQLPTIQAVADKFNISTNGANCRIDLLIKNKRLQKNAVGKNMFARL